MSQYSTITGTGSALPARQYSSAEIAAKFNLDASWITERTGIQTRHYSDMSNPDETHAGLSMRAARRALEMAKLDISQIDGIIACSCTAPKTVPAIACDVKMKLGAENAWAFDVNAACSGFTYGAVLADSMIKNGLGKNVLVIGIDIVSLIVDPKDLHTVILFGDAAGAVIFSASDQPGVLTTHLETHADRGELLTMPEKTSVMKGPELFKVAVKIFGDLITTTLKKANVVEEDVDFMIPHQANIRMIHAMMKRMNLPSEKVLINIDRVGNTSAASVPLALDEAIRAGRIRENNTVLMYALGAGITAGSLLVKMNKMPKI